MHATLLAVLLAAAALMRAQPYRIGPDVSAPAVLLKSPPEYSDEARHAGAITVVVVTVVVNKNGRAEDIKVVDPAGMGLDEEAIRSVATWRFKPGMKDGKPVPVIAIIEVFFEMPGPEAILIPTRIVFDDRTRPGRPVLKHSEAITLSDEARNDPAVKGCIAAIAALGADGRLSDYRFATVLSATLEREVVQQLRRWIFEPGSGDVRMTFCPPSAAPRQKRR